MVTTEETFRNPPQGVKASSRRKATKGVVLGLEPNSDESLYRVQYPDGEIGVFGYWEINPVVYKTIAEKIEGECYDVARSLKGSKKRKEEVRLKAEFLSDLKVAMGLTFHPKGDLLTSLAWELSRLGEEEDEMVNLYEAVETAKKLLPLIQ